MLNGSKSVEKATVYKLTCHCIINSPCLFFQMASETPLDVVSKEFLSFLKTQ